MTTQLSAWIFVLLAAVNSTIGNLMLKHSTTLAQKDDFLSLLMQPYFIGGMFFYGVNVIFFAKALEVLKVSLAYPVLAAGGFTLLILMSNLFMGEQLNSRQYAGVVVVLIGVFLLSSE